MRLLPVGFAVGLVAVLVVGFAVGLSVGLAVGCLVGAASGWSVGFACDGDELAIECLELDVGMKRRGGGHHVDYK